VKESDRVTLKGNTHPLASVKNDVGVAPDSLPMERMLLVLKRSADQEASLKALMEGQQSKSSPNFHQWLTPEQFGQQFGVSDGDIQTVTAWLQTHGFQVSRVAAGKILIEFSGTAGQVREAFHTQIHKFAVNGEEHWANASDPTIPAALAPVINGITSLHNFGKKPMVQRRGLFSRSKATGQVTPLDNVGCNGVSTGNPACLGVGPADFAAIYHVPTTVGGAAPGTGQTIAVVGASNICTGSPLPVGCTTDDILNFRTIFGLPTGAPNNAPKIILDGPDPGLNGAEIEADLDVEYSGAIAPNAQILFVIAADTASSNGVDLAAERIIDFNLAPVLSESFGECEPALGTAGNAFYSSLWEQAAAQGITVIISAGDGGSAACDQFQTISTNGLAVNGIASTPFDVAVGGTDFDFQAAGYPGSFWNTTNGVNGVSAKSYIPETTWNDSCAQSASGQTTGCNAFTLSSSSALLTVAGGAGGQSNCVTFGCLNAYAKPAWQSGSSVPNDTVRDLPDVSFFASDGPASGSFYIICASDIGGTCATGGGSFSFIGVGGTSAAAPAFAGVMALVNQNMVGTGHSGRQGNANFVLYPMSAGQTEANCNSSAGPAANCVFNDVVKGNNSVPCVTRSFGCSIQTLGSNAVGVLETVNNSGNPTGTIAFGTGTGFDLATGLGSINVTNLVNGWPAAVGAFNPTTTSLTLGPTSACPGGTPAGITSCVTITHGATVNVNINVTGGTVAHPITASTGNADDASLIGTCQTATPNCFLGGSSTAGVDRFDAISGTGNVNIYPLTNGSIAASTNELIGGRYNVTAHYAGDGFNGASDSLTPIQVIVNPEGSKSTVTVFGSTTTATSATYGRLLTVRTDIVGSASGFETATGQVTLNDTFVGSTPAVLSLNSDGHAELLTPNIIFPGNNTPITTVPALAVGVHSFSAAYAGDASYFASNSAGVPFTITPAPTFSTITNFPATVAANTNFTVIAMVSTASFGNAPTGTVSFSAGGTLLGTAPIVGVAAGNLATTGTATLTTAKLSATSTITATYTGDVNYLVSPPSAAVPVTVTGGATFSLAGTAVTITTPGQSGTSTITATGTGGFTGAVALTCAVTASSATDPPTCTVGGPISLSAGTTTGTATLTINTTAASGIPFAPMSNQRPGTPWIFVTGLATTTLMVILLCLAPVRKRRPAVVFASLFILVGLTLTGCGSSGGGVHNPGTTVGNYTVTVTGTSGATSASTTVNVAVQ
jgi:hypothetical protein